MILFLFEVLACDLRQPLVELSHVRDPRERVARAMQTSIDHMAEVRAEINHGMPMPHRYAEVQGAQSQVEEFLLDEVIGYLEAIHVDHSVEGRVIDIYPNDVTKGWITEPRLSYAFRPDLLINNDSRFKWERAQFEPDTKEVFLSGYSLLYAGLRQQDTILAHETRHGLHWLAFESKKKRLWQSYVFIPETPWSKKRIPGYSDGFYLDELDSFLVEAELALDAKVPMEIPDLVPVDMEGVLRDSTQSLHGLGRALQVNGERFLRSVPGDFELSDAEGFWAHPWDEVGIRFDIAPKASSDPENQYLADVSTLCELGSRTCALLKHFDRLPKEKQRERLGALRQMYQRVSEQD